MRARGRALRPIGMSEIVYAGPQGGCCNEKTKMAPLCRGDRARPPRIEGLDNTAVRCCGPWSGVATTYSSLGRPTAPKAAAESTVSPRPGPEGSSPLFRAGLGAWAGLGAPTSTVLVRVLVRYCCFPRCAGGPPWRTPYGSSVRGAWPGEAAEILKIDYAIPLDS